jgi:S-adenosylmethionine synthetase
VRLPIALLLVGIASVLLWQWKTNLLGFEYMPADGFKSVVTITSQPQGKTGEWITLNATRNSGPWKLVWNSTKNTGRYPVRLKVQPPTMETEVSDSLNWVVDPPGKARFNLPAVGDTCGTPRKVIFNSPGIYKIHGSSAFPAIADSNVITIRIDE